MLDSRPKELVRAEQLINEAKFKEALKLIENFEKKSISTQKDQLSALLLKGSIYRYKLQYKDAVDIGERVYQLSKELGLISETIEALSLRAVNYFGLGRLNEALDLTLEAEKLLNSQ